MKHGRALIECPIQTAEGVKAADVAWVSRERRATAPCAPVFLVAPEICVEIESPSNAPEEVDERRRLYSEKGAQEVWVCDLEGGMIFFGVAGALPQSRLCAGFPKQIVLD